MSEKTREKKKLGLTSIIFISLILGVIVGVLIHNFMSAGYIRDKVLIDGIFNVVGNGFIKLMKMLVVPLVFCSLVCGTMSMGDTKKVGRIGVKTIGFYLATTACAITVALLIGNLINPGMGLDIKNLVSSKVESAEKVSLATTLLNIIPDNPISSMANGDMLPIIVFALLVGICLTKLGERGSVVASFFSQFNDLMMEMTLLVMKVAPMGVFCLVAKTFSTLGFAALFSLLKYICSVLLALCVQCVGVYLLLFFIFTRQNPFIFLKKFFPVMAFAFSTATSNATIPLNIETLEKKMGVSRKISSFTIPLGATINMDGTAIMQGVAVVFASQAFGIHLSLTDYLTVIATATLASIGTAGIPSVGLVTLSMVFESVGLPAAAIGLIMGVDRILDMTRTAVNITGDAVCTTVIAYQEKSMNLDVYKKEHRKEEEL